MIINHYDPSIMDYYHLSIGFHGGNPPKTVAVACCRSCADLGIFWGLTHLDYLWSLQEVHSLHLGLSWMLLDLISLDFQLRFHRILMDFDCLYVRAQDLPTGLRWTEQLTHSIISRPAPSPRPNSSGSGTRWTQWPWAKDQWTPHLCHTYAIPMLLQWWNLRLCGIHMMFYTHIGCGEETMRLELEPSNICRAQVRWPSHIGKHRN